MLTINPFKGMNLSELTTALANKQKAADDLSQWLSKHSNTETEYKHVWRDRTELANDIEMLKAEIVRHNKPFVQSLNQSFEL